MKHGIEQCDNQEMRDQKPQSHQQVNLLPELSRQQFEMGSPAVLIVEDNPVNQKVAVGLFEKLGCQVYVAESGGEALNLVQKHCFDVVMMDWELPGMDGFETARAIRDLEKANRLALGGSKSQIQPASGFPPCLHLPIVGMTAHGLC